MHAEFEYARKQSIAVIFNERDLSTLNPD